MDLVALTGVVVALVAILAAYHIAARTGTFLKPSLQIRVGHATLRKGYRQPIALLIGLLPTKGAQHFLLPIPIVIDPGSQPMKHVHVQVALPTERAETRLPESVDLHFPNPSPDCHRRVVEYGSKTVVEYTAAIVRRNQPLGILQPLVFARGELALAPDDPGAAKFDELTIHVAAENHPGKEVSILVCAVQSESLAQLQRVAPTLAIGARLARGLFVIRASAPGFIFLPRPHRLWRKRVLLSQVEITHIDGNVAVSSGLDNSATYQTMDFLPVHITRKTRSKTDT